MSRNRSEAALAAAALALGLAAAALTLELGARLLWSTGRLGAARRDAEESLRSAAAYRWVPELRLALPLPGETIVLHKPEYVDRFKTVDLLGAGWGSFDDGLDPRPIRALATGDSFTRGVGSGDQLAHGWVEDVERRLPWLDLVNLGNSGTGNLQALRFYQKAGPLIPHQWVLIDFYSGNDFNDNADPFDLNAAMDALPPEEDRTAAFTAIQRALTLAVHPEYAPFERCRSGSYALRLLCRAGARGADDAASRTALERLAALKAAARDPLVPEAIRALGKANSEGGTLLPPEALARAGRRVFLQPFQRDASQARALAAHSARIVTLFAVAVRRAGARPLFILHPSAAEVYLEDGMGVRLQDLERPKTLLKAALPKDLPVLDLTAALRRRARAPGAGRLFWLEDDHYTPEGYRAAAEEIAAFLDAQPRPERLRETR